MKVAPIRVLSEVDVLIIGGGPAGSAAALTLLKRQGVTVALVEKTDYDVPRIGESLSPGSRPLLEYLGVWEQFRQEQNLESFGSQAAWGSQQLRCLDYMFTLHGSGWGLDRVRFDSMLANAVRQRGGQLLTNTRFVGCERLPEGGWNIRLSDIHRHPCQIHSKYLIDASGRRNLLAKLFALPLTLYDRLVGVGRIGQLPEHISAHCVTQVEACEYGWWYSAPVPGHRLSVVLMSDASMVSTLQATRKEHWQELLAAMTHTRARTDGIRFAQRPTAFPCFSAQLAQVGGSDWVAVGDALASHDPLSSSGIPHALGSGVHGALVAADALFAQGGLFASFKESIFKDYTQYLQTHWRYYQGETRWPDAPFWQRRRTAVAISADALITHVNSEPPVPRQRPIHLTAQQSGEMLSCCRPGRAAHEVVADFTAQHQHIPDQMAILGLQELAARGHVVLAARAPRTTVLQ